MSSDASVDTAAALQLYAQHFFDEAVAADVPALLAGLERNWVGGPLQSNAGIAATLALALDMAGRDPLGLVSNWRLQVSVKQWVALC